MNIIRIPSLLKAIGKQYNLDFCKRFRYYIGDVYNDNKGNTLPSYMYYNNKIYALKYFDGCFNPYLVELDRTKFGFITAVNNSTKVEQVFRVDSPRAEAFYRDKFGDRFEMM
jgi:hypothetical protein